MPEWVWTGIGVLVWAVDLVIMGVALAGLYLVVDFLNPWRRKAVTVGSE